MSKVIKEQYILVLKIPQSENGLLSLEVSRKLVLYFSSNSVTFHEFCFVRDIQMINFIVTVPLYILLEMKHFGSYLE